jgi:hypothetical protein
VQLPGAKTTKTNSKGINDLNKQEVKDLHEAIVSKTFPLRFRRLPMVERGVYTIHIPSTYIILILFTADLRDNKIPVILGAPPPPDVREKHGRRMFVNGKVDFKGIERTAPSKRPGVEADPEDKMASDPHEGSDDTPLDHPQRKTRSSKTIIPPSKTTSRPSKTIAEPNVAVVVPLKSNLKKSSKVKKSRQIVYSDDDNVDVDQQEHHGHTSASESEPGEQRSGIKRKPERRDSGGAKKRVHIIVSSDSESGEDEASGISSEDDMQTECARTEKGKGRQTQGKRLKTKGGDHDEKDEKDPTPITKEVTDGLPPSNALDSQQEQDDPFIGE